ARAPARRAFGEADDEAGTAGGVEARAAAESAGRKRLMVMPRPVSRLARLLGAALVLLLGAGTGSFAARPDVLHLPVPLPAHQVALPILMYHRIDLPKPSLPAITRRLTVDPHEFEAQMEWLKRHGYHAVTELQVFE